MPNRAHPVTLSWDVETMTEKLKPVRFEVFRGETVMLAPRMLHLGQPVNFPPDLVATLWWRHKAPAGWWQEPALATGRGVLVAPFRPDMDNGDNTYEFFIQAKNGEGINYRAFGTLVMLGSPGPNPNQLPLPTKTIDFDGLQVLNPGMAPWLPDSPGFQSGLANLLGENAVGTPRSIDGLNLAVDGILTLLQHLKKEEP